MATARITRVPAVSVLLPFRDAASTLSEAIESVLQQTFLDFELLLVDDGSHDSSGQIAAAWEQRDPRIRLVRGSGNGLVAALNEGLAECRAPWIARMDADDWCHSDRLSAQLTVALESGAQVVGCAVGGGQDAEVSAGMAHYLEWSNSLIEHEQIAREIFVESPLVHPSAFVMAEWLRREGGYRHGDFPEDYDLWLRLFCAGARFAKVPRRLLEWRDSVGRLTRTDPRYSAHAFRTLKAFHVASWLGQRGRCEVQIWGAGPDGRAWVLPLEQHGVRVTRFLDIDPCKIGRRVRDRISIYSWEQMGPAGEIFLLAAVGVRGARELIRDALMQRGFEEGEHWLAVQ